MPTPAGEGECSVEAEEADDHVVRAVVVIEVARTFGAVRTCSTLPLDWSIGLAVSTPTYGTMPPTALSEALNVNVYEPGSFAPATL